MRTTLFAAAAAAVLAGPAQAATVDAYFYVTAINALNQGLAQSEGTVEAAQAAVNLAQAGTEGYRYANFEYSGELDFGTDGDATTIADWLASGVNGTVINLDAAFGALQLSKASLDDNTATTTFFVFQERDVSGAAEYTVTHDDGFALYQITNALQLVGLDPSPGPLRTIGVPGFTGGYLGLVFSATDGGPATLKVEVSPVPLPAAFPLLAAGLAGLALFRRRRAD